MVLERNKVLIISHDVVGERMAGPGIRYYHLARVLAQEFEVVLAIPEESISPLSQGFSVFSYGLEQTGDLADVIGKSKVVLVPAVWLTKIPHLMRSSVPLVVDGYDPFLAELLGLRSRETSGLQCALTHAYLAGDFFICATERQRDWWLGLLEANGRINRHTFEDDPSLRRLVDVVPFGLPEEPPQASGRVLKGVWPGIAPEDKVILWGGGLWSWLDPLTAIRAIERVWQKRPDVRLVFPGTQHPNPRMRQIPTHNESARRLAQEAGLLDRAVFFGEWVPFESWPDVLLESDVAITLHHDTLETRLAFRSRVLDYIWAGLPTVTTRGDATSDLVASRDLGAVVDYGDVDSVAEGILSSLEIPREAYAVRFAEAQRVLTWKRAAESLASFCREPRTAPDKVAMGDTLGNPFYLSVQRRLAEERDRLHSLVNGYERGRFMRAMRWVDRVVRSVRSG
jgi:glycosyltransferase involved in cell wall biosynthesis